MIQNLIVDCGDLNSENRNPGLLYVAVSRAKTTGSLSDACPHPRNSAIYFQGTGMCEHRVQYVSTKYDRTEEERIKKENVMKRDKWVGFLLRKAKRTRRCEYTDDKIHEMMNDTMKEALNPNALSTNSLNDRIAETILNPNKKWKRRRAKYLIETSFFE